MAAKSKTQEKKTRTRRCRWCREPLGAIVYKSKVGDIHPKCAEALKQQLELDLAQM